MHLRFSESVAAQPRGSETVWLKRYPSGEARIGTGYRVRTMLDWPAVEVARLTRNPRGKIAVVAINLSLFSH